MNTDTDTQAIAIESKMRPYYYIDLLLLSEEAIAEFRHIAIASMINVEAELDKID